MALDLHKIAVKLEQDVLSQGAPGAPKLEMSEIVTAQYPIDPFELLGENSFGKPRVVPPDEVGSPIQEFYRGASVFVTGGTGFMGKTLTEKLLRACPHLERVYLLVRPKKGKTVSERLDELFEDRLFSRLKAEVPHFRSKISVVTGDVSLPGLGLSAADRAVLRRKVTVVFHGAATVRFDENIKVAIAINIFGVQAMLELAKEMKHLKSFVHVSTAYTHCPRQEIDEVFYPPPYDYKDFMELVMSRSDDNLEEFSRTLLDKWPNTYTLTKALAEDLVQKESENLPVVLFRPSVIISTYKEPLRGWIDNPYGPVGLIVGVGTGVLHVNICDVDKVTDMVPIDMVVNALIATAWNRASTEHKSIPVYNYVSSPQKPINLGEFQEYSQRYGLCWPTIRAIWYYSYLPTKSKLVYFFLDLFLHLIPGMVLDSLLVLNGQKPLLLKIYSKLTKAQYTLSYFSLRSWTWKNANVIDLWTRLSDKDQDLFFFDVAQLDWDHYCKALLLGLRVYLVKDGIHTLPAARRKWQRLRIAHIILKFSFCILTLWLFYLLTRSLHGTLPLFNIKIT
ncbi:hypothetical protein M8J77_014481 [Diaphorina citri]|nr:hypothetical protein M8J77_014481 [Diaphorina citri]